MTRFGNNLALFEFPTRLGSRPGDYAHQQDGGRNRTMFIASLKGIPDEELASRYRLGIKRVRAILLSEKLKRELSPAPAYHALRAATGFGVRFGVLPN